MNFISNIHYTILTTPKEAFAEMVTKLLKGLPTDSLPLRLVFFGAPASNEEYKEQQAIIYNKVKEKFNKNIPALSYISQPPLNGGLVLEIHSYPTEPNEEIIYKSMGNVHYIILKDKHAKGLLIGGIQGDINTSIEQQSQDAFHILEGILHDEGFDINDIIRQWNYIEQITEFEGTNQNYQSFNNARSDFYNKTEWTRGYPAATGIGMNHGGIIIDADVASFTSDQYAVIPIDNKLQVAAHKYSEQVLENAQLQKTTPKFERAKALIHNQNRLVYISGTAAIRGEESLKDVGLKEQLKITIENIGQLTGNAPLAMLRVYFKDAVSETEIKELMKPYNINIPISYVQANVCRTELLIEIEGIAIE